LLVFVTFFYLLCIIIRMSATTPHQEFLVNYNKFKDKIYTFFWYRVSFDQATAEDLTSEVFIKAFKNFADFDQTRPFQAWIYKIAQNHLINHYKTLGRQTDLTEAEDKTEDQLGHIEIKFELEKAMAVINELPEYHKQVLLLRFVDGLDNSEIATLLQKEEGAIRTQISRALVELRKRLE